MKEAFKNFFIGFLHLIVCCIIIGCWTCSAMLYILVYRQTNGWVAVLVFILACFTTFISILNTYFIGRTHKKAFNDHKKEE